VADLQKSSSAVTVENHELMTLDNYSVRRFPFPLFRICILSVKACIRLTLVADRKYNPPTRYLGFSSLFAQLVSVKMDRGGIVQRMGT
jgi:hypothetical protein